MTFAKQAADVLSEVDREEDARDLLRRILLVGAGAGAAGIGLATAFSNADWAVNLREGIKQRFDEAEVSRVRSALREQELQDPSRSLWDTALNPLSGGFGSAEQVAGTIGGVAFAPKIISGVGEAFNEIAQLGDGRQRSEALQQLREGRTIATDGKPFASSDAIKRYNMMVSQLDELGSRARTDVQDQVRRAVNAFEASERARGLGAGTGGSKPKKTEGGKRPASPPDVPGELRDRLAVTDVASQSRQMLQALRNLEGARTQLAAQELSLKRINGRITGMERSPPKPDNPDKVANHKRTLEGLKAQSADLEPTVRNLHQSVSTAEKAVGDTRDRITRATGIDPLGGVSRNVPDISAATTQLDDWSRSVANDSNVAATLRKAREGIATSFFDDALGRPSSAAERVLDLDPGVDRGVNAEAPREGLGSRIAGGRAQQIIGQAGGAAERLSRTAGGALNRVFGEILPEAGGRLMANVGRVSDRWPSLAERGQGIVERVRNMRAARQQAPPMPDPATTAGRERVVREALRSAPNVGANMDDILRGAARDVRKMSPASRAGIGARAISAGRAAGTPLLYAGLVSGGASLAGRGVDNMVGRQNVLQNAISLDD